MTETYSFVSKKDPSQPQELELLATTKQDETEAAVTFKILRGSLTANNKFYWTWGEKAPFLFNKCYPIDTTKSQFVHDNALSLTEYRHPVHWGIAEVTSSKIEGVPVGTQYQAMLPMGETVSFAKAHVQEDNALVVYRPETFAAYNNFTKLEEGMALHSSSDCRDLALACFPGIITGFGLYFRLMQRTNCYGARSIVVTSASSKVALAMALFLKQYDDDKKFEGIKIVGYTSPSNMEFCDKTGLYDTVLSYDDMLPKSSYVMIDIAGRGDIYTKNVKNNDVDIVKLLVVGNSSNTSDKGGTFSTFSYYATLKLLLGMMGLPSWSHSWMPQPTQELYLIFDDMAAMKNEWGNEKLIQQNQQASFDFCKFAKKWMSVQEVMTEDEVKRAYVDIMGGSVPPSETIVFDVCKAVAHRRK